MLKAFRNIAYGAVAILAVTAFNPVSVSHAATFDLSEVMPESNFGTQNVKKFADAVRKATDGRTCRHSGSCPVELLASRGLSICALCVMALFLWLMFWGVSRSAINRSLVWKNVPFLVSSMEDLHVLHKFWRPEIEKVAEKYNQKFLFYVPSPKQYMYLKIKADSVDQLQGIKIRGADKTHG